MTLPRKNRRSIRLECGEFRYVFTADKANDRGRLVVQIVSWKGLLPGKPNILPKRLIRSAIEFALESGWSDRQFEIGCDATGERLLFVVRPGNSPNDWFRNFDFNTLQCSTDESLDDVDADRSE